MKLTPLSRILIIAAILLGAYFVIRNYLPQLTEGQNTAENTTEEVVQNNTEDNAEVEETRNISKPVFSYIPETPVNGSLKGVVELGASGFNSFIINMDRQKRWEMKRKDFGASLVHENMATEQDVRDGLKQYIAEMLNYGVGGKDIHFVVSSSAIRTPEVQKIKKGLESLGYVVNSVTAEQEGIYALKSVLPSRYEGNAYVVDIGSGNTKVSWLDGSNIKSYESYGSKYYQNNVDDSKVYNGIRDVAGKIPSSKREYCFMIGGAPFQMAKDIREGEERYTTLMDPNDYDTEEQKMKAGLNIYKALKDETSTDVYVFDWDANFTLGFLLSL
ncbi:MAG: hypothetical protein AAFO07_26560 [Bacteroidota bacterium]